MIDESYFIKDETVPVRISSGGVIISNKEGDLKIALIRDANYDDYFLPKGGVENSESLEEAATREISEEAGLHVLSLLSYLGTTEHLSIHKKNWSVTHYYLFMTDEINGKPTETSVQLLLEWFPLRNLPKMLWPDQKKLIEDNMEKILNVFK